MTATAHVPGSLCWFELTTLDQNAAKTFYSSILGWTANDIPMGPADIYTIFRIDGKDAAAACTMRPEQRAMNVPPNWMVYILVESADESAARAWQLGATVIVEPFDVTDNGRMSVIRDPTGAIFSIWQPGAHVGTGIAGVHGAAVWVDLSTPDQVRSAKFYSDLFGWKMVTGASMDPAKPGEYYHIVNDGKLIGGVPPAAHRDPHTPAHWLIYFDVADADATIATVASLGGRVLVPAMTMERVGRFAVLADAQGAAFAIIQTRQGSEEKAPA
jgi:hypothetical protein